MNNFDFEIQRDPFLMALAEAYRKEIEEFQGTLILNPQQFKKYLEAVAYLKRLASEMFGDKVEVSLLPKERHGYATARIGILTLTQEEMPEFFEMLSKVDAFGIYPNAGGDDLTIDISVSNVFIKAD